MDIGAEEVIPIWDRSGDLPGLTLAAVVAPLVEEEDLVDLEEEASEAEALEVAGNYFLTTKHPARMSCNP